MEMAERGETPRTREMTTKRRDRVLTIHNMARIARRVSSWVSNIGIAGGITVTVAKVRQRETDLGRMRAKVGIEEAELKVVQKKKRTKTRQGSLLFGGVGTRFRS